MTFKKGDYTAVQDAPDVWRVYFIVSTNEDTGEVRYQDACPNVFFETRGQAVRRIRVLEGRDTGLDG